MTQLEAGVPPGGHCSGPVEADSGLDEGSSGQDTIKLEMYFVSKIYRICWYRGVKKRTMEALGLE